MALKSVDDVEVGGLMMSFLLQRLLTLPRTLETFSGIIIERQEVRILLNLEILRRMIPLRLIIMINLEKKYVNLLIILWVLSVLDVKGMVT